MNPATPVINVAVPVPQPAAPARPQTRKPPPAAPQPAPQPAASVPQQQPMMATAPLLPTAFTFPWTPEPKQQKAVMRRRLPVRVVRYASASGHPGFLDAIRRNPTDSVPRGIYADYIEEHDPQAASPGLLDFLREYQGPAWAAIHPTTGQVHAGRKWTMPEIRQHMNAAGSNWFSRGAMRFFGTRIHGQPFHGPGGVTFVTNEVSPYANPAFTVRSFQPSRPMTDEAGEPTGRSFSPQISTLELMGHPTLAAARAVAARIAAGHSVDRANPEHMAGRFA